MVQNINKSPTCRLQAGLLFLLNLLPKVSPDLRDEAFFHPATDDGFYYLFMDFKDLLAYLTLRKHYPAVAMTRVPKKSDYIVLNEIENWQYLFARIGEYDTIYCFFPNTDFGGTLTKTIDSLHEGKTVDYSTLYPGCKSLTDYLQLQKGRI